MIIGEKCWAINSRKLFVSMDDTVLADVSNLL